MRTLSNHQITRHFSLYEVIEGAALPAMAIEMNWKNVHEYNESYFEATLSDLETIRIWINFRYKHRNNNKTIGIRITSGWRCKEWELHRNRSGEGRHPIDAIDFQPITVNSTLAIEIMHDLDKEFIDRTNGYQGGYARALPTYEPDGFIRTLGFLHIDKKLPPRRWWY